MATGSSARRLGAVALFAATGLSMGCSWARFDQLKEDTPVASLEEPKGMDSGFGNRLATTTVEDRVRLFVLGSPGRHGGASYDLGLADSPSLEASDAGHCTGDGDLCYLAAQPVALPRGPDTGEELELCLVAGLGTRFDGDGETTGLITRCEAGGADVQFAYPLPNGTIANRATELLGKNIGDAVLLGTNATGPKLLVAVWPQERHAWFYLPRTDRPIELMLPPGSDGDKPTALAVVREEDGWLVAIGASKVGHVWLIRVTSDGQSTPVGCLGGLDGLGRALTAGPVARGNHDDLVLADDHHVHVLSGKALATLPPVANPSCSLTSLPANTLMASFSCGQTPSVSGCESSDFGAALAVGDVDGDGDGEVIVGAPLMSVRGEDSAGAILLYDVEGKNPHELTEVKFISSAEQGDHLGESLATPRIDGRHVIAAGAPGGGKAVIFYCNVLLPSSLAGPRCD